MTDDLVPWLRAQLDDDERVARESVGKGSPGWSAELDTNGGGTIVSDGNGYRLIKAGGELDFADAEHIARHDPARVLAEVDAKRRIVNFFEYERIDGSRAGGPPETLPGRRPVTADPVLRLLALPYAGRPGYRNEWKP